MNYDEENRLVEWTELRKGQLTTLHHMQCSETQLTHFPCTHLSDLNSLLTRLPNSCGIHRALLYCIHRSYPSTIHMFAWSISWRGQYLGVVSSRNNLVVERVLIFWHQGKLPLQPSFTAIGESQWYTSNVLSPFIRWHLSYDLLFSRLYITSSSGPVLSRNMEQCFMEYFSVYCLHWVAVTQRCHCNQLLSFKVCFGDNSVDFMGARSWHWTSFDSCLTTQ